ncbi:hypothetical protein XA68_11931 [Ophiocordyceps unilateralis]|uniref:Uncharacterized protein n=1 Tax=Ophiocordyceps unilateralis TaxID=268505 RepID=A0A2A9PFT7_OPHUN|nr:hypothetical protein XA68_11931 [Ophiocordyceps unilateralis]
METTSNIVLQAAKLVWGDQSDQREPISGAQGNVSRGEPYDAGNMNASDQQGMSNTTGSNRDVSSQSGTDVAGGRPMQQNLQSHSQNLCRIEPSRPPTDGAEARTVTEEENPQTKNAEDGVSSNVASEKGISKTQISDDMSKSKATKDSAFKSKPAAHDDSEKHGHEEGDSEKPEHQGDEEGDSDKGVMGDGPKPLEVVARENGGDAGNNGDPTGQDGQHDDSAADDGDASESNKQSKGTGELHVKTTGFAADGGDFDAAKPGAAREADRLMEEKKGGGFGRSGSTADHEKADDHEDNRDKPSLGERIKHKMHKH